MGLEVDERWIADYQGWGVYMFERMLGNQARFDAWLEQESVRLSAELDREAA